MTELKPVSRATHTHNISPIFVVPFVTLCLAGCEFFVGEKADAPVLETPDETEDASTPSGGSDAGSEGFEDPPAIDAGPSSDYPPIEDPPQADPPNDPPKNDPPGNPPNDPPNMDPVEAAACQSAPLRAQAVVQNFCSGCHGNIANAKANFNTVLDPPALLANGKVVKDEPDMSPIYKRISTGSMPPAAVMNRPGPEDIAAIKEWIACGAQDWNALTSAGLPFVSIDTRLRTVLTDLRSIPNPADRVRARYIDLSALANSGISAVQLQTYRDAVSFLLNSLSRGRTVIAPTAIDKDKLIYRIDLRDYEWEDEDWTQLEAIYPYAVVYDQDSRLFPFDEATADQIRDETETQIPVIYGDWFISHASRPPIYHNLLDLPNTLAALQQDLGIDIQDDIDDEQVLRSGFLQSGMSQNNRVIERHDLGGNRGGVWIGYDFQNNLNNRNVFANPLDFQADGADIIFHLDNGLQGYFIVNGAGQRLDKAPNNLIRDPKSRDGAAETGLSCMSCHMSNGVLPKVDEIRNFQLTAGVNAQEIEDVLAIYVPEDQMQDAFDDDKERYRQALSALGITRLENTTMHELDDTHLGVIDLNGVSSIVGLRAGDLQRAIDASPQTFPPEIVTLRTRGGGIQRDSFEAIVEDLVEALGLGEQLVVNNQGNRINN